MSKSIVRDSMDVFVCIEGKMSQIDIRDIIYVEHSSRTVILYTLHGIVYIPYIPLYQIGDILGNDYLSQCHKSYLVNRCFVERIDRTENLIVLKNYMGEISLGRKYRTRFLREMHLIE